MQALASARDADQETLSTKVDPPHSFLDRIRDNSLILANDVAVVGQHGEHTYGELWADVEAIAAQVALADDVPGRAAGVAVGRGYHQVVGLLAVMLAGKAYLPIDRSYPKSRRDHMLTTGEVGVVVGDPFATDRQVRWVAPTPVRSADAKSLPRPDHAAERPCYVLFTSGSTGNPKGVAVPHGTMDWLVDWQVHDSPRPDLRTVQGSATSFDVSVQEILSTLVGAGQLVLVTEHQRVDPTELWQRVLDTRAERIFLPFVALNALAQTASSIDLDDCRLVEVITAGEQLLVSPAISQLFHRLPACELVNQYGPTETHVVTSHRLTGDPDTWDAVVPIGKPLPHVGLELVHDATDSPGTEGAEPGQIVITGEAVALGYLGGCDEDDQRFSRVEGRRTYQTGDYAIADRSGILHYKGRRDDQTKIRGYRIELTSVDSALMELAGCSEACAVSVQDARGVTRLLGVLRAGPDLDLATAHESLISALPAEARPSRLVVVDRPLPRTGSGKLDRRTLAATLADTDAATTAPRDPNAPEHPSAGAPPESMTVKLAEELTRTLGAPVTATTRLRPLMTDSLTAATVASIVTETTGAVVGVRDVLTAEDLTDLLARGTTPAPSGSTPPRSPELGLLVQHRTQPRPERLNVVVHLTVSRAYDLGRLNDALAELENVHPALVRGFGADPTQRSPLAAEHSVWHALDLTKREGETYRHDLEAAIEEMATVPFDLELPPLTRWTAVHGHGDAQDLVLVVHHAIIDGASLDIVVRDLLRILEGDAVEPPSRPRMTWPELNPAGRNFWQGAGPGKFSLVPPDADQREPGQLRRLEADVEPDFDERLRQTASSLQVTTTSLLLTSWATALAEVTRTSPSHVAVPRSLRDGASGEAVAYLLDTLPIPIEDQHDNPVEVHRRSLLAQKHAASFDEIVRVVRPERRCGIFALAETMVVPDGRVPHVSGPSHLDTDAYPTGSLGMAAVVHYRPPSPLTDKSLWVDLDPAAADEQAIAQVFNRFLRDVSDRWLGSDSLLGRCHDVH